MIRSSTISCDRPGHPGLDAITLFDSEVKNYIAGWTDPRLWLSFHIAIFHADRRRDHDRWRV